MLSLFKDLYAARGERALGRAYAGPVKHGLLRADHALGAEPLGRTPQSTDEATNRHVEGWPRHLGLQVWLSPRQQFPPSHTVVPRWRLTQDSSATPRVHAKY